MEEHWYVNPDVSASGPVKAFFASFSKFIKSI